MASPPLTEDHLRPHRRPERSSRDRAVIDPILDAGFLCHLGYVRDGRPIVLPTLYGRDEDHLLLHGSTGSGTMLAAAGGGLPVCATVTLVDGLVLARSSFDSSANYRCVVVHGDAEPVEDPDEKVASLAILTDHVVPGRWAEARQPTAKELAATTVLRLPLTHAVAKLRAGGAGVSDPDRDVVAWSGVLPLATVMGPPQPSDDVPEGAHPPAALSASSPPVGAPAALR